MTPTAVATSQTEKQIARPLRVLVPLIKEDLEKGKEASHRAGLPYYRAAGEKMLEAKAQLDRGEFLPWVKRNFGIGKDQSSQYMRLAAATADIEKSGARYTSLSDFVRDSGGSPRGSDRGGVSWHEPVKQIIGRVDTETLNLRQTELNRAEEREAQRELALQLIDIGYKTLATKLHPDKGGSRDAMSRLNQVRDRLKQHA